MSESDRSARPRQLTMAGGFVIGGSVLLLVTVFDSLARLRSMDTRDQVSEVLSGAGKGLGLTVAQALEVMRVGLSIAAVCAAATAVLGVFVLQRHRGARIALSVLAVPILVTAPLTGGLMGALVAAATLALWSGPARDWFAGRPVRQPAGTRVDRGAGDATGPTRPGGPPDGRPSAPEPPAQRPPEDGRGTPARSTPSALSTDRPSTAPGATTGFGERPGQPEPVVPPAPGYPAPEAGGSAPPGGSAPAPGSGGVPLPVRIACLLTWVFSGVVALLYAVMLVVLIVASDRIVDFVVSSPEWERANLDPDLLLPVLWFGCLMFLAWSGGALVLAWFTWRRHNWARYLLVASAGAALVAAMFAFPAGLPHQLAAIGSIVLLFNPRARTWFARPAQRYGPPPGPPGPPSGQPGQPGAGEGAGQGAGEQDWGRGGPPAPNPPPPDKPPVW